MNELLFFAGLGITLWTVTGGAIIYGSHRAHVGTSRRPEPTEPPLDEVEVIVTTPR
jgi:hypothetical protein